MKSVGFICDNEENALEWERLYNNTLDSSGWSFNHVKKFSGNNTGNIVHRLAALRTIDEKIKFVHTGTDPKEINSSCKLLVMTVANMIDGNEQLWINGVLNLSESSSVPVILFGLGAQANLDGKIPTMPKSLRDFFLRFVNKGNHLLIRGETTKKSLFDNGIKKNIHITGCQSLFLNGKKNLGQIIEAKMHSKIEKLIYFSQLSHAEPSLNTLYKKMTTTADHIMVNGCDGTMWNLFSSAGDQSVDKEIKNLASLAKGESKDKYNVFVSPNELKSFLKSSKGHVLTPRIHGAMISIASELPTICTIHDGRVNELCKMHKIPFCNLSDSINKTPQEIFKETSFSGKEFDENRKKLSQVYINIFEELKIKHSKNLIM
tara:strand:- start:1336 stop:2460 length:1125 start_codon:yes stop_codon:yes gene_type:complete